MDWHCEDIFSNLDWDPWYLLQIFHEDFEDMSYLWSTESVSDQDLLKFTEFSENKENYSPQVEDISLEDEVLCNAVDQIEAK